MSKNKVEHFYFDRTPVTDSIPEISVPETNRETNSETETSPVANDLHTEGCVYAEGYKSVRLRKEPNEKAEVLATVPVGENIIFGDTINGWTKVSWLSFSGWMMEKYVIDHR